MDRVVQQLLSCYHTELPCEALSLSDVQLGAAAERYAMEQCRARGWGVAPSEPDAPFDFEVTDRKESSRKVQSKATRWSPEYGTNLVRFGLEKKADHKRVPYSTDDTHWFVFTLVFPHPDRGSVLTSIWLPQRFVIGSSKASFLLDEPRRHSNVRRWHDNPDLPKIYR
jgi:hypothetical protein